YRAGIEGILGLTLTGGSYLSVKPALPADWPGYRARINLCNATRDLSVTRGVDGLVITLDGKAIDSQGGFQL
ncbi:MAG: hypothetical protein RIR97_254, partial [Pseudomonadota bacterium]